MKINELNKYSNLILRIGISSVFLWFGINQLVDQSYFLGYLPDFILNSPYQLILVKLNGLFEIILGLFLLLGLFTRIVSFILFLHLLAIIYSLGYNDIAIRDFGLAVATLAIFLHGKDDFSLDSKLFK